MCVIRDIKAVLKGKSSPYGNEPRALVAHRTIQPIKGSVSYGPVVVDKWSMASVEHQKIRTQIENGSSDFAISYVFVLERSPLLFSSETAG